jgi:hypothetical protein
MFLLFCFFLGCHEESSGEQFSLGNVFNYLPGPLPETALLIVGIAALIQDIAVLHPRCQYNYCGVVSFFPWSIWKFLSRESWDVNSSSASGTEISAWFVFEHRVLAWGKLQFS